MPDELADAACRLATGGGFGGRELYSDHDEAIFDATRPLVFNAIPDLGAARPDFLDRAVIVEFLDMKPEMRRDEAQFWREFEEARPRILGALLDAAVAGLRICPPSRASRYPEWQISLFGSARVRGLWGWKQVKHWKLIGPIAPKRAISHSRSRRFTNPFGRWLRPDSVVPPASFYFF